MHFLKWAQDSHNGTVTQKRDPHVKQVQKRTECPTVNIVRMRLTPSARVRLFWNYDPSAGPLCPAIKRSVTRAKTLSVVCRCGSECRICQFRVPDLSALTFAPQRRGGSSRSQGRIEPVCEQS